jgi:hypothetical protein
MKSNRLLFLVLTLLMTVVAQPALAWPDQPPDRAFIAGPGLNGEVEIIDTLTLEALRLGVTEDFAHGPLDTPTVEGEAYKITRYFEGGTFNFATLYYYPDAGYLYFEDGDDLISDHTAHNEQWYPITPLGDAALQNLLSNLGVHPAESKAAAMPSATVHRLSAWLITLWERTMMAAS